MKTAKRKPSKAKEDMKEVGASPSSVENLMAEVRYAIVFGEMNEVFNGHVHRLLSFLWIFAAALSGGSLLTLLGKLEPSVVLPWTIVLGIISAFAVSSQRAFKFQEKEVSFRKAKMEFQLLEGRGWSMSQEELQKTVAKLRSGAPSGGAWLAPLAYNRACNELGHSDFQIDVPTPTRIVWRMAEWA